MPSQGQWMGLRAEIPEQRFSLNWSCQSYVPVSETMHAFPCLAQAELAHLGPTFTSALEHLCH